MSLATSNRDGGKTSESGHLRAIMKGFKAQVLTGLNVSQRGAGANMSVDVAIGDAIIPRSDATYGHPAWADAIYNVAITTADVSNPRRDIVVMYIDYGNAVSTAVSNNTNGVVKIIVVPGTPAGSPSDPSGATIQSAVGSGNPYIKLARVRVGAGVTTISNSVIDDLRLMATGLQQGGWTFDELYSWVYATANTFTVAGVNVTSQFPQGAKIALYQGGVVKYFVVASSSFSTNTTVTLVSAGGATVYTLANVPIDRPAFSIDTTPVGFPGVIKRVNFGYSKVAMGDGATVTGIPLCCVNLPTDYVPGTDIVVKCSSRNTSAVGVVERRSDIYRFRDGVALSAQVAGANVNRSVPNTNVVYSTLHTLVGSNWQAGDAVGLTLTRNGSAGPDTNNGIEDCDAAWIEYTASS